MQLCRTEHRWIWARTTVVRELESFIVNSMMLWFPHRVSDECQSERSGVGGRVHRSICGQWNWGGNNKLTLNIQFFFRGKQYLLHLQKKGEISIFANKFWTRTSVFDSRQRAMFMSGKKKSPPIPPPTHTNTRVYPARNYLGNHCGGDYSGELTIDL